MQTQGDPTRPPAYTGFWVIVTVILGITVTRLGLLALGFVNLYPREAALWVASQMPALGYDGGPPLVPMVVGLTTAVCGDTELCLRAPGVIATGLTGLMVWRLGTLIFGRLVGFWSAVLFTTLPAASFTAAVTGPGAFLPLFWVVGMDALVHALKTDRRGWWMMTGTAFGLGLLTDYTMALFALCFVVYAAISPEYHALWRRRGLWQAILLGLAVAAPHLIWLATRPDPGALLGLAGLDGGGLAALPVDGSGTLAYLLAQFLVFGPIPVVVLLWVAFHPSAPTRTGDTAARDERARQGYRTRLFLAFSLPVVAFQAALAAIIPDLPPQESAPALVAGAILVTAWLLATTVRRGLLRLAIILHIVGAALFFNLEGGFRVAGLRPPANLDPFLEVRGMEAVGRWGAALADSYPGARLVFDDPSIMATLQFYIHPHPLDAVLAPGGAAALAAGPAGTAPPGGWLLISHDSSEDSMRLLPRGARDAGFMAMEIHENMWQSVRAVFLPGPASGDDEADRATTGTGASETGNGSDNGSQPPTNTR